MARTFRFSPHSFRFPFFLFLGYQHHFLFMPSTEEAHVRWRRKVLDEMESTLERLFGARALLGQQVHFSTWCDFIYIERCTAAGEISPSKPPKGKAKGDRPTPDRPNDWQIFMLAISRVVHRGAGKRGHRRGGSRSQSRSRRGHQMETDSEPGIYVSRRQAGSGNIRWSTTNGYPTGCGLRVFFGRFSVGGEAS